jgi:hypothetical protein
VSERICRRRRTETNRLESSSELRLEQYDEQDSNDIKQPVKKESDHVESDEAAESYEDQYENDALDKLPCSGLSDEHQDRIEKECNESYVDRISDEVPRAAEKERALIKAVKKLAQEFKYLADDRCI